MAKVVAEASRLPRQCHALRSQRGLLLLVFVFALILLLCAVLPLLLLLLHPRLIFG
jgi:hypothetical protein